MLIAIDVHAIFVIDQAQSSVFASNLLIDRTDVREPVNISASRYTLQRNSSFLLSRQSSILPQQADGYPTRMVSENGNKYMRA